MKPNMMRNVYSFRKKNQDTDNPSKRIYIRET